MFSIVTDSIEASGVVLTAEPAFWSCALSSNMNTMTNRCMSQKSTRRLDQLFGKILTEISSLRVWINNACDPASHFLFYFHPRAPATAQTFQIWLWVMADTPCSPWNEPLSHLITRLNRIQFDWQCYSDICLHRRSMIMKNHTRDTKTDGQVFHFLSQDFFFFFSSHVTGSDNWPWNWYETKTSKWNRSCQGNLVSWCQQEKWKSRTTLTSWDGFSVEQHWVNH